MTYNIINPIEIRQQAMAAPAGAKSSVRGMGSSFGDFMAGVSAMSPFASEFTYQATGNPNAATVLNAAFTSFPAAASAFSGQAPSWAAGYGGGMGSVSPYGMPWGSGPGGIPNLGGHYPEQMGGLVSGGQAVPGTNLSQFQLMDIMNQNNLRLIELQAIMQSNMQTWNTKSNILSADHRAKMSMIEKFTARG